MEKNILTTTDLYSIALFALYKLTKEQDYAIICNMLMMFDKDVVLKLCDKFGGTTIKIPTLKEVKTIVDALGMYYFVDVKGQTSPKKIPKNLQKAYDAVKEAMNDYVVR